MPKMADFSAPITRYLCAILLVLGFGSVPVSAQIADPSPPPSATGTPAAMDQQQRDAQAATIKESQNPVGNVTLIQFRNNVIMGYTPYGTLLFGSSGITANWQATPSQRWLVPLGTGVVKTFRLNKQTMQLAIYYFGNVVRPAGAPFGTIRVNYNLVFPITRGR